VQRLGTPHEAGAPAFAGMFAVVANLAYHLGGVRQIAGATRGPATIE
jgi:hypothetical protein